MRLTHWLHDILIALLPLWVRVPINRRIEDDLYEARLHLMSAQHNNEHWRAQETMFRARVIRLEQLRNDTDAGKQGTLNLSVVPCRKETP